MNEGHGGPGMLLNAWRTKKCFEMSQIIQEAKIAASEVNTLELSSHEVMDSAAVGKDSAAVGYKSDSQAIIKRYSAYTARLLAAFSLRQGWQPQRPMRLDSWAADQWQ